MAYKNREYLKRARDAGLMWPLPTKGMDDASLEKLLYPRSPTAAIQRFAPDWEYVNKALKDINMFHFPCCGRNIKRSAQMVMNTAGSARITVHGQGKIDISMRFNHRGGENLFINYTGHTIPVIEKGRERSESPRSS